MGQQQLLLLVLGAIIVGVAIVVGINMFGSNALKANEDAVRQDCLTFASRIQECYRKPTVLGGVARNLSTITTASTTSLYGFPLLGYRLHSNGNDLTTPLEYTNENGTYTLSAGTGGGINIEGQLLDDATINVNYLVDESSDPNVLSVTMVN